MRRPQLTPRCLEPAAPLARRKASGADGAVLVRIGVAAPLPDICHLCGRHTVRTVVIERKCRPAWWQRLSHLVQQQWGEEPPPGVDRLIRLGAERRIRIALPQCRSCDLIQSPQPQHVDFTSRAMSFYVHRAFRAAYLKLQHTTRLAH